MERNFGNIGSGVATKPAWEKPELVRLGGIADVHVAKPANLALDAAKVLS